MNAQVNAVANTPDAHRPLAKVELDDDLPINAYANADSTFMQLLESPDLDEQARAWSAPVHAFEQALCRALGVAYDEFRPGREAAHLFLQRVLYRIYRLNLFWYDDLASYTNERSVYLFEVRARIEAAWQPWERAQVRALERDADIAQVLVTRAAADLDPPFSADDYYFRDQMTVEGYRHLLAIASLDGLVEASQLSRILGGAANPIHARLTRLLLEEYGFGHLERKHSSYFTTMLQAANMSIEPGHYLALVPWEVLALTNQSFLFSEQRRYFLRYIGGLLYFETAVPAAFRHYQAAAKRLGFAEDGRAYWNLHIHADERHGCWMLHDVALPLVEQYSQDAWQMVWGYDQQRNMSARAGKAVVRAVWKAQQSHGGAR